MIKKIVFLKIAFFIFPIFALDFLDVPKHVAIIMDGNRRWAENNDFSLYEGYLKGAENLLKIIEASIDLNIDTLTVYAFSTENWKRSQEEIDTLFYLFEYMCINQRQTLIDLGVKLNVIGDISKFPQNIIDSIIDTKKACKDCKKLDLILAINYGGRDEMKRAFLNIIEDLEDNKIIKDDITESLISCYLDTKDFKDPDLIIRTASEARLSNFLLWQAAYSEIYIAEMLWPDFSKDDLINAILDFQKRKRKIGV